MEHAILVILGFLAVFVLGMLAVTGLKHALRRLVFAIIGFAVVFLGMFFGVGWATGAVPSFSHLPTNIQQPDFWMQNWVGLGLGLILAILSTKVTLTRKV